MTTFKPENYNSLSPYFIINGAQKLIDLLTHVFRAEEVRRYDTEDGKIMHAEVRIDDSIVMISDSSEQYPPNQLLVHLYVPDVDDAFRKAVEYGCEALEKPKSREGDPDRRGMFKDFGGNVWAIGTQKDMS